MSNHALLHVIVSWIPVGNYANSYPVWGFPLPLAYIGFDQPLTSSPFLPITFKKILRWLSWFNSPISLPRWRTASKGRPLWEYIWDLLHLYDGSRCVKNKTLYTNPNNYYSNLRHINFPISAATRCPPVLVTPCYQLHSALNGSMLGVVRSRVTSHPLEWVILPHPLKVSNLSITRCHTCRILPAFLHRIGRTPSSFVNLFSGSPLPVAVLQIFLFGLVYFLLVQIVSVELSLYFYWKWKGLTCKKLDGDGWIFPVILGLYYLQEIIQNILAGCVGNVFRNTIFFNILFELWIIYMACWCIQNNQLFFHNYNTWLQKKEEG